MSSRIRIASVPVRPSASTSSSSGSRAGTSIHPQSINSGAVRMRSPIVGNPLSITSSSKLKRQETSSSSKSAATVSSTRTAASNHQINSKVPVNKMKSGSGPKTMSWTKKIAPAPKTLSVEEKKEEKMITSTGTESSGVFSDTETPPQQVTKRPAQTPSRITTAVVKTTSKLAKRVSSTTTTSTQNISATTLNDQAVIAELRNQIANLKSQWRDQIEQLNRELGEKFRNDTAALLAEQESQFQKQLEVKEAAWGAELSTRLEEERSELARRLAERDDLKEKEKQEAIEAVRTEERTAWQQQLDELVKRADQLHAEKERLEKTIRQEVDARVQATVQRYNELQKETSSLQAVFELRCHEVKALRQELERACAAAAEAPTLRERNHSLVNHVEGLQAQLELRNNEERRLQAELVKLKAQCKDESSRIRLLSMEKEQLQYRLQQRHDCDRMSPPKSHPHSTPLSSTAETPKLARRNLPRINLSPIVAETNGRTMCNGDVINGSLESAGSSRGNSSCGSIDVDDVFQTSPAGQPLGRPASPTIRDFTEKNDSVSYVLDIGDRSPSASPLGPPPALSPWPIRRNNLVRSASLRYPARHPH